MEDRESEPQTKLPDELVVLPYLDDSEQVKRWVRAREALYDIAFAIEDRTIMKTSDGKCLVVFDKSEIERLSEVLDGFEFP